MANLSFFGLHPRLLQRLDLGLSPPAVSESAAVDLSFEIAAGAESRAGLLLLLGRARAVRSSREVGQKWSISGEAIPADPPAKMARVKRGRAVQQRGEDGEQLTLCPSLVVVVICKQATCSSTDLPPSPGFPSFPPPSAVEVYLEEDAMHILEHSVTPQSLLMVIMMMMPLGED